MKRRVQDELFEASTLDHLQELGVTHVAVHPFLFKMSRERKRLLRWERKWGVGPERAPAPGVRRRQGPFLGAAARAVRGATVTS